MDLWDPADGRGRDTPGRHLAAVGCRRSHARCLAGRASGGFFGLPAGQPRGGQTPVFLLLVPARALVVGASGKFGVDKTEHRRACVPHLLQLSSCTQYTPTNPPTTSAHYILAMHSTPSRSPAHTQLCAIFQRAKAPFALALSTTVELRALLQQIALALPHRLPQGRCSSTPTALLAFSAEPAASSGSSRAIGLFPVGANHVASVITEHCIFALPAGARFLVSASTGRVRGRLAGRVHLPQAQWWAARGAPLARRDGRRQRAGSLVHTSCRTPPRHPPGRRSRMSRGSRQSTGFGHRQG